MILEVDIEMNQIRQSIGAEVRFKFFQFSFVYITFAIYVPANLQIFELQAHCRSKSRFGGDVIALHATVFLELLEVCLDWPNGH